MDAVLIKKLLAHKYRRAHGWSFFEELFLIDGYAIGFQSGTGEILAFEIKTSRADFLKDIRVFHKKQAQALKLSHKFYYVCPWGLIEKSEVPDFVGLQYVDKANVIKIKKIATYRSMTKIPFFLLQSVAYKTGDQIDVSNIPVKYLGKEITQQKLQELIDQGIDGAVQYKIEREVEERMEKIKRKKSSREAFILKLREVLWRHSDDEEEMLKTVIRYTELGKFFSQQYPLKDTIRQLKEHLDKVDGLIQDPRQLKLKKENP